MPTPRRVVVPRSHRPWFPTPTGRASEVPAGPALRAAGLVTVLLVFVQAVLATLVHALRAGSPLVPGMLLVTLHMAVMLWMHLTSRYDRTTLWLSSLPLVVGFLLLLPHRSGITPINYWTPGYWAMPWMVAAIMVLPRVTYLVLAGAIPTVMAVLDVAVQQAIGAPLTRWYLEPIPGFFTPVLLPAWLCDALIALARTRDDAQVARERAEQQHASELACSDARREAARLVHDHLLHALHAVAQTDHGVDVREAAAECDTAYAALTSHHGDDDPTDLHRAIIDDPALTAANAVLRGSAPAMPRGASRALVDATHEALTNVAQHAHARSATVDLDHAGDQWLVTVSDDGTGFDPSRTPRNRMGVRQSIIDRVRSAGGAAEVRSTPGHGTRVTLVWPAVAPDDGPSADDDLAAHNATARAAWPALIFAPVFTAILWPYVHPVWPVLVACAVLVAVGVFHILRLRHHALTTRDTVVLMGTSLAVWAVDLWCAPAQVHTVHPLWLAWGAAGLAHLVVLQTQLRRGILALAAWTAGMTGLWWVRSGGRIDWANTQAALTVGLSEAVIALVVFHGALRYSRESSRQRQLAAAVHREAQRVDADSQLEQYWSQRVTSEAIPLLRRLADDPSAIDDRVRAHAVQLEATLRDELVLGPGNASLLDALRQLREQGWVVVNSIGAGEPALARAATRLAADLGPAARPGQPLTLSAGDAHVTAVALGPSAEQATRWRALGATVDPDFCRIVRPAA